MFAERLKRARKAAGLSMQALADAVGISPNAIKKYEHGEAVPGSPKLLKLAQALEVRTEYFFRPTQVALDGVEYRKHANVPQKLLNRINADVMDQAERWAELLDLYPDSVRPIPAFGLPDGLPSRITGPADIEALVTQLREAWQLGNEPIPSLIDLLESKGVMVIATDVETEKQFDGLAGAIRSTPVVVLSSHRPGDRQRFTLAHELGHLVLHDRLDPAMNEEQACNHFAGAFILPGTALKQRLGEHRQALEGRELYMLKQEFGISMMAVLMRAWQCGVISDSLRKRCFMAFGKNGWRTQEPGDAYPRETTWLFEQLVYRALAEDFIGESKAAELMQMPLAHFHRERKLEADSATADQ